MSWRSSRGEISSHSDLPNECTHIVYQIHYIDGTRYIGYRTVRSERVTPSLLSGKERIGARRINRDILTDENGNIAASKKERKKCRDKGIKAKRVSYDVILKDLPFINYFGSSEENAGKVVKSREILHFTSNKRTATYLETKLLFENNILFNDTFNNKNIGGRHFDNAMDGIIQPIEF